MEHFTLCQFLRACISYVPQCFFKSWDSFESFSQKKFYDNQRRSNRSVYRKSLFVQTKGRKVNVIRAQLFALVKSARDTRMNLHENFRSKTSRKPKQLINHFVFCWKLSDASSSPTVGCTPALFSLVYVITNCKLIRVKTYTHYLEDKVNICRRGGSLEQQLGDI